MFADNSALGVAEQALQDSFGFRDRLGTAGKFREEGTGIGDLPADIYRGQQVEAILSEAFGELIFKVLDALIEPVDHFDAPRQSEFESGFGDGPGWIAEAGDNDDFGLTHLEGEQQQSKDHDQENPDNESEWTSFHGQLSIF
jgi:hypothetical protein